MTQHHSKLELAGGRTELSAEAAVGLCVTILRRLGLGEPVAQEVAEHLVEADRSGVESHGVMRILQYAEQYRSGHLDPRGTPVFRITETGAAEVDGRGGIGIPAMRLAFDEACHIAGDTGLAALAVRNAGHTGRHGAFAEQAAENGFLTFLTGGGKRQQWRQVAPHGGAKALLPTNPWCVGIPGGAQGANVLDFATSKIAGGWIYAARAAGALLPEGCIIDSQGRPTRNPEDYFNGGAILPAGEHKGFALALMGEMIGEAMLGPVSVECNWLLICLDTRRFREGGAMMEAAEEILSEMRSCPPAPGFERVEIPGERELGNRQSARASIALPDRTLARIEALAQSLADTEQNVSS